MSFGPPDDRTQLTPEQAKLVERHVPLVEVLAKRVHARRPDMTLADLVSAGYEAMVRKATEYVPGTEIPFEQFVRRRVQGAMQDAARQARPELERARRARRELEVQDVAARAPSAGEERPRRKTAAARLALNEALLQQRPAVDVEQFRDTTTTMDRKFAKAEVYEVVREVVSDLPEAEQDLVVAVFFNELSQREYARQIGRSYATVSRTLERVRAKLSKRLLSRGVPD